MFVLVATSMMKLWKSEHCYNSFNINKLDEIVKVGRINTILSIQNKLDGIVKVGRINTILSIQNKHDEIVKVGRINTILSIQNKLDEIVRVQWQNTISFTSEGQTKMDTFNLDSITVVLTKLWHTRTQFDYRKVLLDCQGVKMSQIGKDL